MKVGHEKVPQGDISVNRDGLKIDWSKTAMPAIGALVANFNHPKGYGHIEFIYSPSDRGRYREGPASWEYHHAPSEISIPEWDGEDRPPVGAVCEFAGFNPEETTFDDPAVGDKVTIIAHYLSGCIPVAAFTYNCAANLGALNVAQGAHGCFRPVRTAEQIVAEEREKAIDQMIADTNVLTGIMSDRRIMAGQLYDANWRKKVEP